jgi:hypothetical protein
MVTLPMVARSTPTPMPTTVVGAALPASVGKLAATAPARANHSGGPVAAMPLAPATSATS